MILFHGSREIVRFPEVRRAVFNKDFYFGFYCTVYKEQAERWATRYGKKGYVNSYDYIPNPALKYLKFEKMTDEWLDFIVDCRSGKPHEYDIVIGAMADDQIYNYISDFVDGTITREQFWVLAKFKYPTHQINFCTNEALKCLKYRGCEEVDS